MPTKFGDAEPVKVGDEPTKLVGEAVVAKETKSGIEALETTQVAAIEGADGKLHEVSIEHPAKETLQAPTAQPLDGPHASPSASVQVQNLGLVTYGLGFTKKTQEYENVRPFVQLTMPCAPNPQAVEQMWEFVLGWVDTKASQIHEGVDASLKS